MINRPLILLAPDSDAAVAAPPAPAPAPVPSPTPSPAPSKPPTSAEPDPWADLDRETAPPPEPQKAATPPKPEPAKPAPAAAPKEPKSPPELRAAYETAKTEVATLRTQLTEVDRIKAELADAKRNGESLGALTRELAAAKKEAEETRTELARTRYEPSPEVKSAVKSWTTKTHNAQQRIMAIGLVGEDGTTIRGEPAWKGFMSIYNNLGEGEALDAIRAKFGDNQQIVSNLYLNLREAQESREAVEAEDRANFGERVQKATADRATHIEGFKKMVGDVIADLVAKTPEQFADDPKDPDGNALLKKGLELGELVTSSDKFNTLSPAQKAIAIANTKLRLGNYPRLQHRNRLLTLEVDRLKAENEQLRNGATAPPGAKVSDADIVPQEVDVRDELEKESKNWESK